MSFAQTRRGRQTVVSGPSAGSGRIVFHADDFGMNCAVTDGIVRGFQHGLITSTALLANAPDAGRRDSRMAASADDRRGRPTSLGRRAS